MIDWKIKFVKQDCWIGVYWKRRYVTTDVYICIIPCLPLILTFANNND